MRILHFYKLALPESMGGVQQLIDQLARGSSAMGAQVDVLALSAHPRPPQAFNGYKVHTAQLDFVIASTSFSRSAFSIYADLAKKADVIHFHFPWPFMDLVHFISRVKKPTVVTYHSDIVRQKNLMQLYKPLSTHFLKAVDRIVATSPNYLASSDVLAPLKHKAQIIPIGLDPESFPKPCPKRIKSWHERLGPKYFVFLGVLRYYKGLHILLEAAKNTPFPIAIAGTGPMEDELRKQVQSLGLNNVHLLGYLSEADKVSLISGSLGLVFPSHMRSEAFGISLLEGAMFGKPLISCEIGTGTSFINIHQETGIVVPPSDPLALRLAMQTFWNDPQLANAMGQRAQERFTTLFTADRMVKSYLKLYQDLPTSSL